MFVDVPDIIILSETWLNDDVSLLELNLKHYNIFRSDRERYSDGAVHRGGGVLIGIINSIKAMNVSAMLQKLEEGYEELLVRITTCNDKFLIGAVYFPPSCTERDYLEHILRLEEASSTFNDHKILLCGDYNLPHIHWGIQSCGPPSSTGLTPGTAKLYSSIIYNGYSTYQLAQHHPIHLTKGYTLDLMFGDVQLVRYMHSSDQLVPIDKLHHGSATFSINTNLPTMGSKYTPRRNFKKKNVNGMLTCLGSIDWEKFLDFDVIGLNAAVDLFYDCLLEAVKLNVPMTGATASKFPYWYTPELKNTIMKKKIAHKKWKTSNDLEDEVMFKKYRAVCTKLVKQAYRKHMGHVQGLARSNLKEFWQYINSHRKSYTLPSTMTLDHHTASDATDVADMFVLHFKSVFKTPSMGLSSNFSSNSDNSISVRKYLSMTLLRP